MEAIKVTKRLDTNQLDGTDEDTLLMLGSRFSRLGDTGDKTLHRFRLEGNHREGQSSKRKQKRVRDRVE